MIDFTDFLPTVADAARISIPADYDTIDGVSFYKQLTGAFYTPRDWIFDHYQPALDNGSNILKRWIQDTTYKLYDSTGKFYNIFKDPGEKYPIKTVDMTPQEKQIKKQFQNVMDTLK
jgi:arylsulfatase A